jgi:hypothetical protein
VIAGDFGLANTYWWLGVFGGALLSIPAVVVSEALQRPRVAAVLFLVFVAYIVPVMIGIWNAAGRYQGRKLWAILARVVVVIAAVRVVSVLIALPGALA